MVLTEKVALVTGGAVRIGRAICRALAAEGARVVVHYGRSEDEARRLAEELGRMSGRGAEVAQADLVSEDACRGLIEAARKRMGRLDILVNSAAVFNKHSISEVTEERVLGTFWPNLFAPMLLTRYFAEACREGGVINLLDRRITAVDPTCVPYLLTKKGLAELTKTTALALAPHITVNAVAPGAVLPPPGEGEGYLQEHGGPVPLERQCTTEEIAAAAIFLLKSDALTGQVVYVDGGQHLLGAE